MQETAIAAIGHVLAFQQDPPTGDRFKAANRPHRQALAAVVQASEANNLALPQGEIQVFNLKTSVAQVQVFQLQDDLVQGHLQAYVGPQFLTKHQVHQLRFDSFQSRRIGFTRRGHVLFANPAPVPQNNHLVAQGDDVFKFVGYQQNNDSIPVRQLLQGRKEGLLLFG